MRYACSLCAPLVAVFAFALVACTPHVHSQLVAVVDTNLVADTDYDHVHVRVTGPDGVVARDTTTALTSIAGTAGITLPFSFGIYPAGGDATRPVTVFVEALLGSTSVVSYQAVTSYESGHVLELDLFLERACVGRMPCVPDANGNAQECGRGGQCVPVAVAPATLMDYNADAGFDATIAPDVTTDTVGDAGADMAVDVPPAQPRQLSPMSASLVSTGLPPLTWNLAAPYDGASFEICATRDCGTIAQTIPGTAQAHPTTALRAGTWYWRVWPTRAGVRAATPTATWQFTVTAQIVVGDGGVAQPRTSTVNGIVPDLTGDGLADLIVSAPTMPGGGTVVVYPGDTGIGPTNPPTTFSTLHAPAAASNGFGNAMAAAGDVDGDGFGDLVVAAPGANAIALFHGANGSVTPTADVVLGTPGTGFGTAVAGVGDVNGDGYGDVAVGEPLATGGDGAVTVYFGSATGLHGNAFLRVAGNTGAGGHFGAAVSGGGDVNGDGLADLVVGAPLAPPAGGSDGGIMSRGMAAVFVGAPSTPFPNFGNLLATAFAGTDLLGASVGLLGDINGDGLSDLVIGAPGSTVGGSALEVLGNSLRLVPQSTPLTFGDGGQSFASSVGGAGDVNGDGYADVLIGSNNLTGRGLIAVYPGGSPPSNVAFWSWQPATSPPIVGGSVTFAGDVNGDGFCDVLGGSQDPAGGTEFLLGGSNPGAPLGFPLSPQAAGSSFGYAVAFWSAHAFAAPTHRRL